MSYHKYIVSVCSSKRKNIQIVSLIFRGTWLDLQHGHDRAMRYRKAYCGREWNWNRVKLVYKCEDCIGAYGQRHTYALHTHSSRILLLCRTHCKVPYTLYSSLFFAQSVFSYSNSSSISIELVVWLTLLYVPFYAFYKNKTIFFLLFFSFHALVCYSVAVLFFFFRPFIIIQKRMKLCAVSDLCCKDDADDDDDDVINCRFICIFFGPILSIQRERQRPRTCVRTHFFLTFWSFHFISNPFF